MIAPLCKVRFHLNKITTTLKALLSIFLKRLKDSYLKIRHKIASFSRLYQTNLNLKPIGVMKSNTSKITLYPIFNLRALDLRIRTLVHQTPWAWINNKQIKVNHFIPQIRHHLKRSNNSKIKFNSNSCNLISNKSKYSSNSSSCISSRCRCRWTITSNNKTMLLFSNSNNSWINNHNSNSKTIRISKIT